MKRIIIYFTTIGMLLLATGCAPVREVPVHTTDTIFQQKIDTLVVHRIDSTFIHAKNDTVWVERFKVLWRDKITYRDSIQVQNKEIPVEVPVPTVPQWCWYLLLANILCVVVLIIRFVIKIYLRR